MRNILAIVILFSLLTSCEYHNTEDCHQVLTFVNNTNKHLYISGNFDYPDTLAFKYNANPKLDAVNHKVDAMQPNKNAFSDRTCFETKFRTRAKAGVLMIYVFDGATLENTSWEVVKENNTYLYRYDLSLQDLKDRNWQIQYNGE